MENRKLTPLKFLPDVEETPWGKQEYLLADLGFKDSMAIEGWLSGNTVSEIMETYLERLVGESAFDWYGVQFPVMVKRMYVKGRTSLHINADDETAAQRYDAFGKTALWYVEDCGPEALLYLGFRRPVGAEEFFGACSDGSVEPLLHTVRPKPGESYLVTPGMVHAAKDVTLLEIAESSNLWFRLHGWGSDSREIHLEEAFDLIDLGGYSRPASPGGALLAETEHFTVGKIALDGALRSSAGLEETFLIYICEKGGAKVVSEGVPYNFKAGEMLLVPAEAGDFELAPTAPGTLVLEVRTGYREPAVSSFEADGSED